MNPAGIFLEISSPHNERFRSWLKIIRQGETVNGRLALPVEGPKLLEEALVAGWEAILTAVSTHSAAQRLIHSSLFRKFPSLASSEKILLSPPLYTRLTQTAAPQEPLVIVQPPPRSDATVTSPGETLRSIRRLAVADGVQDPGNLGTLIRSAWAFGFPFMASTLGSARYASSKVLRASAGTLFRMQMIPGAAVEDLARALIAAEFLTVVLDPKGPVDINTIAWKEPLAIVVGNEAQGPSPIWLQSNSPRILHASIPMTPGCESLNTATAAALAFHTAFHRLQSR